MSTDDWTEVGNILCVRLDAMGDVLMNTPALRALKEARPGRQLTLLTSLAAAELAAMLPPVDAIIPYDAPWMKATAPRSDTRADFALIERLRRSCFDGAVIFTVYSQNPLPAALVCLLAGIPRRLAHCRENPYQLLTHWVREPEPHEVIRHEVRRQLDLVAAIGCTTEDERLSLRVPRTARTRPHAWLREFGIHDDITPWDGSPEPSGRLRRAVPRDDLPLPGNCSWVVIHPGASAPSRRYPAEGFAQAADLLAGEHGVEVVFAAGPQEVELVESIRARMEAPSHSLAGRLDLAELAALIEAAPLLICNNSGPAHVAAAVGTPVVDLYALTNPQHTPWAVPSRVLSHDVPCKNCYRSVCPEGHHDCLRRVPPEAVVRAACELLGLAAPKLSPVPLVEVL
jgi:ADP-heptose:LPS heptosyltransferase